MVLLTGQWRSNFCGSLNELKMTTRVHFILTSDINYHTVVAKSLSNRLILPAENRFFFFFLQNLKLQNASKFFFTLL